MVQNASWPDHYIDHCISTCEPACNELRTKHCLLIADFSHRTLAVSHGHRLSITTTNECRNTSVAVRRPIYSTTRPSPINSAPLRRMLSCMCCLIINRHKTQTTSATTCSCAVSRINYCEQQFPLSAHLFEILRYSVKRLNLPSKVFTSL